MKPFDYFKKTFVFVFVFFIVYKAVGLVMNKFEELNLEYIFKNILVAFVTAITLGGINYFTKINFFTKNGDRKPNNN